MGAGASTAIGADATLDRKGMLKATSSPAYLMNRIFKYITEEFSEKDLFKLQDEATCREFLILGADSLQQFFTEIRLQPKQDKSGRLFFAKVSDIVNPKDEDEKQVVRNNCLALSYFYVRLLQIYVALALTLIDNATLIPGEKKYIQARAPITSRKVAPGAQISYGARGGAGSAANVISAAELGLTGTDLPKMIYVSGQRGGSAPSATWSQTPLRGGSQPTAGQRGGAQPFTFDELVRAGILETTLGGNRFTVHGYPNLNIVGTGASGTLTDSNYVSSAPQQQLYPGMYGRTQTIQPSITFNLITSSDGRPTLQISQLTSPTPDKTLSNIGVNIILRPDNYEPIESDVPSLPDFFKTIMGEWLSGSASTLTRIKERTSRRGVMPRGKTAGLDYETSISALRAKPLAHCVARSFQLLQVDALGPKIPPAARSYICNTKFIEDSLKTPTLGQGDSITKVPGLNAFNFLFFVLEKNIQLSERTRAEYEQAIKILAAQYSDKAPEFDVATGPQMMSAVRYSGRGPACTSRDKDIILRSDSVKKARQGVAALWGYQIAHAKKVDLIFRKLFRIQKSPSGQLGISINPALIANGIPALELINAEARKVLLEYYSNCEKIYQVAAAAVRSSA